MVFHMYENWILFVSYIRILNPTITLTKTSSFFRQKCQLKLKTLIWTRYFGLWHEVRILYIWIYKACYVNGIKYVSNKKDHRLVTQNNGLMLSTETKNFYGYLDYVFEVCYPDNLSVILFKGIWHNTTDDIDAKKIETIKVDQSLISVDTNTSYYDNSPFCLAIKNKCSN